MLFQSLLRAGLAGSPPYSSVQACKELGSGVTKRPEHTKQLRTSRKPPHLSLQAATTGARAPSADAKWFELTAYSQASREHNSLDPAKSHEMVTFAIFLPPNVAKPHRSHRHPWDLYNISSLPNSNPSLCSSQRERKGHEATANSSVMTVQLQQR